MKQEEPTRFDSEMGPSFSPELAHRIGDRHLPQPSYASTKPIVDAAGKRAESTRDGESPSYGGPASIGTTVCSTRLLRRSIAVLAACLALGCTVWLGSRLSVAPEADKRADPGATIVRGQGETTVSSIGNATWIRWIRTWPALGSGSCESDEFARVFRRLWLLWRWTSVCLDCGRSPSVCMLKLNQKVSDPVRAAGSCHLIVLWRPVNFLMMRCNDENETQLCS